MIEQPYLCDFSLSKPSHTEICLVLICSGSFSCSLAIQINIRTKTMLQVVLNALSRMWSKCLDSGAVELFFIRAVEKYMLIHREGVMCLR